MKRAYHKIFFIGMVLAVFLSGCGGGSREDTADLSAEAEGAEILAREEENGVSQIVFTCQDMDGNAVSEAVFSESKLTMVNVWATYCEPCLREMPGLGELAAEYEPETFRIIGIISDVQEGVDPKAIETAEQLIEMTGASYTHLLLNESVYYALLTDVTAVPTTFFVNENGEVVDTVIGSMEKTAWEDKINALLEES